MDHRFLRVTLSALLLALPLLTFAQESSSSSGSVVPAEAAIVTEDREFRLRGFAESLEKAKQVELQYRERRAVYARKRAENRSACREDIRRSNKNTLVKTLLRCYENELRLLSEFTKRQQEELGGMAGLSSAVRSAAVARVSLLADAVDTLIFAIESGVYGTKDDILEAKRNMYTKYELPLWETRITVRADRTLTWIASLIAPLDTLRQGELAAGSDRSELVGARACLVDQEKILRPLLQQDLQDRPQKLASALTGAQDCIRQIRRITRILNASGSLITQP